MTKKYVKRIPIPVLMEEEAMLFQDGKRIILKAKKYHHILVVTLFTKDETYVVYCQKKDYIVYYVNKKKWGTKKAENMVCAYNEKAYAYIGDTELIIKTYFSTIGFSCNTDSAFWLLNAFQTKIRFSQKHKKTLDFYAKEARIFDKKPIPKKYDEFVLNTVFDSELIFIYNKRKNIGICTRCRETVSIKNMILKHNAVIICPMCKRQVTARSEKMQARSRYSPVKWSLLLQRDHDIILGRYFCHCLYYKEDNSYQIITKELLRDKFSQEGLRCYEWQNYKHSEYMVWGDVRESVNPMNFWMQPSIYSRPTHGITIYPRIASVEYSSFFRNSAFCLYFQDRLKIDRAYEVSNYLYYAQKTDVIEKMVKLGYKNLVQEYIFKYTGAMIGNVLHIEESSISKIFGLNRNELKILHQIPKEQINSIDIFILQTYRGITAKEFLLLRDIPWISRYKNELLEARKDASISKILRYMEEKCSGMQWLYFDYLKLRKNLEYPKKDSFLYPKDLKKMHDRFVKEWNQVKEEKLAKELKMQNVQYMEIATKMEADEKFHFEDAKYSVVIPKDMEDFKKEGTTLNHCVYSNYFEKAAKGEVWIFFIRRKEALDKPFFTLEIKDGKIIQCLGVNNHTPLQEKVEDVNDFVKEFHEHLLYGSKKL